MIAFVWAQAEDGTIGLNGQLPWHLPNDLKFFKEVTLDTTIVMGRKTFEGMGKRLLPQRKTIILTRQPDYRIEGAQVVHDRETILRLAQHEDLYIVGGAEIYTMFADDVEVLYQTVIHETFEGDTIFPTLAWDQFSLKNQVAGEVDARNRYPHTFKLFIRQENTKK